MGLQILIAGCPSDERSRVEGIVRRAIGQRAEQGAWSISLVWLVGEWQVTINGPEPSLRGVSLTVPEIRLQNAIVEAVSKSRRLEEGHPTPPAASSRSAKSSPASTPHKPSAPATGETRDRHECPKCGQGFVVVYAKQPGEATTKAPVACPKCWQVMQVPIALEAAQHEDYRAETV